MNSFYAQNLLTPPSITLDFLEKAEIVKSAWEIDDKNYDLGQDVQVLTNLSDLFLAPLHYNLEIVVGNTKN